MKYDDGFAVMCLAVVTVVTIYWLGRIIMECLWVGVVK